MNPYVLASIAAETQSEFRDKIIEALERGARGLEFRFDSVKGLSKDFVKEVIQRYRDQAAIVSTFRHLLEAGPNKELFGFKGVETKYKGKQTTLQELRIIERERKEYIQLAINSGTHFYDIEAFYLHPRVDDENTLTIVSFHEFDHLLNWDSIHSLYTSIRNHDRVELVKMVFQGFDEEYVGYANRLLDDSSGNLIAIAMGELGQETRKHKKSYFTYTTLEKNRGTADGQLTLEEGLELFPYETARLLPNFSQPH